MGGEEERFLPTVGLILKTRNTVGKIHSCLGSNKQAYTVSTVLKMVK